MKEEITFQYMHDGIITTGHWYGDPDVAILAAIDLLAAVWDPKTEMFLYEDPETRKIYQAYEHDLVVAGAAIKKKVPFWDWYTVWCTRYGDPVDA